MFCKFCGHELYGNAVFCSFCAQGRKAQADFQGPKSATPRFKQNLRPVQGPPTLARLNGRFPPYRLPPGYQAPQAPQAPQPPQTPQPQLPTRPWPDATGYADLPDLLGLGDTPASSPSQAANQPAPNKPWPDATGYADLPDLLGLSDTPASPQPQGQQPPQAPRRRLQPQKPNRRFGPRPQPPTQPQPPYQPTAHPPGWYHPEPADWQAYNNPVVGQYNSITTSFNKDPVKIPYVPVGIGAAVIAGLVAVIMSVSSLGRGDVIGGAGWNSSTAIFNNGFNHSDAQPTFAYPYDNQTLICPRGLIYFVPTRTGVDPTEAPNPSKERGNNNTISDRVVIGEFIYYGEGPGYGVIPLLTSMSLEDGEKTVSEIPVETMSSDGQNLYAMAFDKAKSSGGDYFYILTHVKPNDMSVLDTYSIQNLDQEDWMVLDNKLYYRRSVYVPLKGHDVDPYYRVLDLDTGDETMLVPKGQTPQYRYICGDDKQIFFMIDNTVYSKPHDTDGTKAIFTPSDIGFDQTIYGIFCWPDGLVVSLFPDSSQSDAEPLVLILAKDGSHVKRVTLAQDTHGVGLQGSDYAYSDGWLVSDYGAFRIEKDKLTEMLSFGVGDPHRDVLDKPLPLEEIKLPKQP